MSKDKIQMGGYLVCVRIRYLPTLLRSLQTSARSDHFEFKIAFSSSVPGNIIACSFLRSLHHSDNSSGLILQYLRLGIVEPFLIYSTGILHVCMQCV